MYITQCNYIVKDNKVVQSQFWALGAALRDYGIFESIPLHMGNIRLTVVRSVNFAERSAFLYLCCQSKYWCRSRKEVYYRTLLPVLAADPESFSDMFAAVQRYRY